MLGRPSSRPIKASTIEREREHAWRRPGEMVQAPLLAGEAGILMKSWFIIGFPPGWKLVVNVHHSADPLPDPHCHGGRFLGLVLWGGYDELRVDAGGSPRVVTHRPGRLNYIGLGTFHRVLELRRRRSVTLALLFPNVQEMGWLSRGEWTAPARYFGEGRQLAPAR